MDAKTLAIRSQYLDWIKNRPLDDGVEFFSKDDDHYRFVSDYATGELNFYDLEMYVTELRITNSKTLNTEFFLHFELNDLDYAKELFKEFAEVFSLLREQRKVSVLLSCTSAITTTYMANKLNDAAKLLSLHYDFSAVAYPGIYEKVEDKDMVLLAPQIALETEKLAATLPDKPVISIPPKLFATYDAPGVLEVVRKTWQEHLDAERRQGQRRALDNLQNDASILTIATIPQNKNRFAIHYRYYRNGAEVFEETVIKQHVSFVHDICDILDTAFYRVDHYDIIGISTGGIIQDGCIDLEERIDKDFNLKAYLEDRYSVPVIIKNNTNTAAYAINARHPEYRNVAFLSLPFGYRFGGVGMVIDSRPHEGSHNIAGEVKFTVMNKYKEGDKSNFTLLPGETLGILEKYIRQIIAMIDPDIVVIRCQMMPDTEVIRMRLVSYIPERYMPKLRLLSDEDSLDYMLLGMMLFCIEELKKQQNNR